MYFLVTSAALPFESAGGAKGGGVARASLAEADHYLTLVDQEGLEQAVLDEAKDVLLEVVATDGSCVRCQELVDGFDALAGTYDGDPALRSVMYDVAQYGTHPLVAGVEPPAVLLFGRGAKGAPVRMEGDRFDTGALDHWASEQLGRSPAAAAFEEPSMEGQEQAPFLLHEDARVEL